MSFTKFLHIISFFSFLNLNFSEAKIVCYNETWNKMVREDYQAWYRGPRSSTQTKFQNNSALAYCEYLSQRSQFSASAEARLEANKLLTLIYEVGAYFGLVEASAEEALIAKRHLKVIAQNLFQINQISTTKSPNSSSEVFQVMNTENTENTEVKNKKIFSSPSSEVLQIINTEVKNENRQIIQNPNTSILTEYIKKENQVEVKAMTNDLDQNTSYRSLRPEFKTWIKFLAGDTQARTSDYSNIYAVRQLSSDCLEGNHNYIQLLFPNSRKGVIPTYYLDSNNALNHFANLYQNNAKFRNLYTLNLKLSFFCMMKFYGLATEYSSDSSDPIYQNPPTFTWKLKRVDSSSSKIDKWISDHNCFRLTRILIALKMAHIDDLATMLYSALQTYGEEDNLYWENAAENKNYSTTPSFRSYSDPLNKKGESHP